MAKFLVSFFSLLAPFLNANGEEIKYWLLNTEKGGQCEKVEYTPSTMKFSLVPLSECLKEPTGSLLLLREDIQTVKGKSIASPACYIGYTYKHVYGSLNVRVNLQECLKGSKIETTLFDYGNACEEMTFISMKNGTYFSYYNDKDQEFCRKNQDKVGVYFTKTNIDNGSRKASDKSSEEGQSRPVPAISNIEQ